MKYEEIMKEITDLLARLEAITGEQALIGKRLNELFAMLVDEVETEVKEIELEEDPEDDGEDVVSDILNGPMDDEQRELLVAAGLIEPEKPKDPPTEELIATPEEAKAAEEALGKVEEVAPPPSKPKARVSAMSRLSAKKADSEPEDDDDDDDDDDEYELEFLSGDPDENGEYPDPDD
ncbi:hypothetical protein IKG13_03705 [Candidatus Saccharibacteria bacterium]|nr:hypothetical protein [Candidatus Saccharibacteria bacterium]MBR3377870.1 hypothetical protein [Candidatus Saccharibacteria bacterium]